MDLDAAGAQRDTGWVFGTELPKLTLNEVYVEYDNDPADPATIPNPNRRPDKRSPRRLPDERLGGTDQPAPLRGDLNGSNQAVLQNAAGTALYQVVLTTSNNHLRDAGNIAGDPDNAAGTAPASQPYTGTGLYSCTPGPPTGAVGRRTSAAAAQSGQPRRADYTDPTHTNQGFFVLGPSTP